MTRAELQAAVIGRPGAPPDALDIIDAIVATQTSIALIEARRRPDGTLTVNDQAGLEVRSAPLSRWFQILGLYPVEGPA
jgi:hypothetical protein